MAHSRFRPCIDLHDGVVKQIVGGTLSDASPDTLQTNFVAALAFTLIGFGMRTGHSSLVSSA